jgi:hypothetical protein
VWRSRVIRPFDADFLTSPKQSTYSRGVYNVQRNEGLERLLLRILRGHVLYVWLSIRRFGNAAGMRLWRRVHLWLELHVRERRELRLHHRLARELFRPAH